MKFLIPIYCICFSFLLGLSSTAQTLSDKAAISLLTYAPQEPLYTAFGHSSIRIIDPLNNIDRLYNYGTFNFNDPGFYAKFIAGKLHYYLGTSTYDSFQRVNVAWERNVTAQELQLDSAAKQAYFDYLENNYLPANRYYYYDFFYDNCATRIYDGLLTVLGDSLQYNFPHLTEDITHRDLLTEQLQYRHWDRFGIDLILGAVVDRKATNRETTFLPDYLEAAFEHSKVKKNGKWENLAAKKTTIYEGRDKTLYRLPWYLHPAFTLWTGLGLVVLLTFFQWNRKRNFAFDYLLFFVAGVSGWILFLAWFATEHTATAQNWNLLWLNPLHIFAIIALFWKPNFLKTYFLITLIINALVLFFWNVVPQSYNVYFIPIILMLGVRAFYIWRKLD